MTIKDWNDAAKAGFSAQEHADAEWARQKANGQAHKRRKALRARKAEGIAPEKISWLWCGRLAVGKHTCVAGDPGTGKSQTNRQHRERRAHVETQEGRGDDIKVLYGENQR